MLGATNSDGSDEFEVVTPPKKKKKPLVVKNVAWIPFNGGEFEKGADKDLYGRWVKYKRNVELNMKINKIDNSSRAPYFLSVAGTYIQELDLYLPECSGDDKALLDDYEQLIQRLTEFFKPKTNIAQECNKFRDMKQERGEKMTEYVVKLREQAEKCFFADTDTEIKMQVINKCFSTKLKSKFLEKDYTLNELMHIASVSEMKDEYLNLQVETENETEKMFAVSSRVQSDRKPTCYACGFVGHKSADRSCRARGKECKNCHKMGHFAKVCRSGRNLNSFDNKSTRDSKYEKPGSSSGFSKSEQGGTKYLFAMTNKTNDIEVEVGSILVHMLIDSGADINCLTLSTWNYLKSKGIKVRDERLENNSNTRVFAYGSNEPMQIKGSFICLVQCGNRILEDRFYVSESGTSNILGRETSVSLGILRLGLNVHAVSEQMPKLNGKIIK